MPTRLLVLARLKKERKPQMTFYHGKFGPLERSFRVSYRHYGSVLHGSQNAVKLDLWRFWLQWWW